MAEINDGGSAFPSHGSMGEVVQEGMSLLDYFAIHADSSEIEAAVHNSLSYASRELIVGRKCPERPQEKEGFPASILSRDHDAHMKYQIALFEFNAELMAKLRYKMADAMLKAREVQNG